MMLEIFIVCWASWLLSFPSLNSIGFATEWYREIYQWWWWPRGPSSSFLMELSLTNPPVQITYRTLMDTPTTPQACVCVMGDWVFSLCDHWTESIHIARIINIGYKKRNKEKTKRSKVHNHTQWATVLLFFSSLEAPKGDKAGAESVHKRGPSHSHRQNIEESGGLPLLCEGGRLLTPTANAREIEWWW